MLICDETLTPAECREELGYYDCSSGQCVWISSGPAPVTNPGAEPVAAAAAATATATEAVTGTETEAQAAQAQAAPATEQQRLRGRAYRVYELEGVEAATISFLVVAEGMTKTNPKEAAALTQAGLKGLKAAFELQGMKEGKAAGPLLLDGNILASKEATKLVAAVKRKYSIEPGKLLSALASSPGASLRKTVKGEGTDALLAARPSAEATEAALAKSRAWSIRDRLRQALANRGDEEAVVAPSQEEEAQPSAPVEATRAPASRNGTPEYAFEGLTADSKEFFEVKATEPAKEEERSLTLFDVVHLKYREIAERRASSRRGISETMGMLGDR